MSEICGLLGDTFIVMILIPGDKFWMFLFKQSKDIFFINSVFNKIWKDVQMYAFN